MALHAYGRLVTVADELIKALHPFGHLDEVKVDGFHIYLEGIKEHNPLPYFVLYTPDIILGPSIYLLVNYIRAVEKALGEHFVTFQTEAGHDIRKADFVREVKEYLINENDVIMFDLKDVYEMHEMHIDFRINEEGNYLVYFGVNTSPTASRDELKWHVRDALLKAAQFRYEDHKKYLRRATIQTELEERITMHPTKIAREYLG